MAELLGLSEFTLNEFSRRFLRGVCSKFESKYLWRPTLDDINIEKAQKVGFPGALGSLDCSGRVLNCEEADEQRRNIGNSGSPELRLESACYSRLWIWHLKFWFPGDLNDINILDFSPLFTDVPGVYDTV